MSDSSEVDVYIEGQFWCRMPREEFDRLTDEGRLLGQVIRSELEAMVAEMEREVNRQIKMNAEHGWLTVIL